ncbi:GNAT family N-acetyltransferase [Sporolactobacillus sp. THM7-7]|nr:GNAT family N-acetyltransferase [Sporolactobacillus sp. THM7-7]
MIRFKQLTAADAEKYREVRLEALQKHPEAFASEYGIEVKYSSSDYEQQLSRGHVVTLGTFDQEQLIGIVTLVKETLPKMEHRATLEAVYVKPEYRGQSLSKRMIEKLEEMARREGVVKKFYLFVMTTNTRAIRAYQKMGFSIYGEDKDAMKEAEGYVDEYLMVKYI